jgi:two-component system, NarL family, nitrate/nitrite response regulator NarL
VIRVLVVSDVCLYREGLAGMLARRENVELVETASGGREASEAIRAAGPPPDVILLDARGADVGAAVRLLRQAAPAAAVIALSVPNREDDLLQHAEAGVAGLVTREASFEELVAAIESAARGEALCSPSLAAAMLRRLALRAQQPPEPPVPVLTSRELEVVGLIDEGLSNKQIAHRLSIELPTVKNHVHHILGKLGVERRRDAAALVRARRT